MSPKKKQRVHLLTYEEGKYKDVESNQNFTLDSLPPEMLEMILHFLSYQDVASSVRLVSRKYATVATSVLNNAFLAVGSRLERIMNCIKAKMFQSTSDMDLLLLSKAYNALEIIKSQYKMLKAVTWRYTHPPRQQKFFRLCFYAGSLLDNLHDILRKAKIQPSTLFGIHNTDPIILKFTGLCKRFIHFFERVSEHKVNKSVLVSGCKVVDILDCLIEGREVLAFRLSPNRSRNTSQIIRMKVRYVMKRAWFTCLEVPNVANENSWRDEQRFMYLRLRRLVGSVNQHLHANIHYERELLLQTPGASPPRPPPAFTYSGYGEYGGHFFYYGSMNKYAYENRIKFTDSMNMDEPEENAENDEEQEVAFDTSDLVVTAELRCSPELAPLAVRVSLKPENLETINKNYLELYLKLTVTYPACVVNRLPRTFVWELRTPRHTRKLT